MTLSSFTIKIKAGRDIKKRTRLRGYILGSVLASLMVTASIAQNGPSDWPMFGQNAANTATNPTEQNLSTAQVSKLQLKWSIATTGDVSARGVVAKSIRAPGSLWLVPPRRLLLVGPREPAGGTAATATVWSSHRSRAKEVALVPPRTQAALAGR